LFCFHYFFFILQGPLTLLYRVSRCKEFSFPFFVQCMVGSGLLFFDLRRTLLTGLPLRSRPNIGTPPSGLLPFFLYFPSTNLPPSFRLGTPTSLCSHPLLCPHLPLSSFFPFLVPTIFQILCSSRFLHEGHFTRLVSDIVVFFSPVSQRSCFYLFFFLSFY